MRAKIIAGVAVCCLVGTALAAGLILLGNHSHIMSGTPGQTLDSAPGGITFTWGGVTYSNSGFGMDASDQDNTFTSAQGYTVTFSNYLAGPPKSWDYDYKDAQGTSLQTGTMNE